jgi:hypothetical protein
MSWARILRESYRGDACAPEARRLVDCFNNDFTQGSEDKEKAAWRGFLNRYSE